jgi:Asp-tRNA(Asn)/Glu-tRNA(Gln) amidotransferase A subunit family amidase
LSFVAPFSFKEVVTPAITVKPFVIAVNVFRGCAFIGERNCAVYANLAGLPAVSVPYGRDAGGMPLAVHLTAARFQERLLLEAAMLLEEVKV